ncbi:MAG: hypothetical protein M3Q66_00840 [Chloroflexota bacterium]|nr:hypothetical protein [Chloroflexota bacterium]
MHRMIRPLAIGLAVVGLAAGSVTAGSGKLYTATLTQLNAGPHVVRGVTYATIAPVSGHANIRVVGDVVTVEISVNGATQSVHPQHIHAGPTCPTMSADVNNDTYVDVLEGIPAYGPILVNLDSNLNDMAANTFPSGSSYMYSETALKSHLQDELDLALKLGSRHVVIHGIDTALPASVDTLPGLSNTVTLPVACGEMDLVR